MRLLLAGLGAALFLAGCGGAERAAPTRPAPRPEASAGPRTVAGEPVDARAAACVAGSEQPLRTARRAYGAVVRHEAPAFRAPGGRAFARFGRLNANGVPTVFGVLARVVDARCRAVWYRVQLPARPNGATGWVRAADVDVAPVRTRILVDLSARRVTLFRDGRPVVATRAAIGSPATPTPTGSFYVNQRLRPRDAGGPFGPGAIGISAFSEVLTGWVQGGPIAIHGTNRPASIGRAVSNGCIRVDNRVLERLFRATLAGTPVEVRA